MKNTAPAPAVVEKRKIKVERAKKAAELNTAMTDQRLAKRMVDRAKADDAAVVKAETKAKTGGRSKVDIVTELLQRQEGATLAQLTEATGSKAPLSLIGDVKRKGTKVIKDGEAYKVVVAIPAAE